MAEPKPLAARVVFLAVNRRFSESGRLRKIADYHRSGVSVRRIYDSFKLIYPRHRAKSLAAREFVAAIGSAFANPNVLWQALDSNTDAPILLYYFGSGRVIDNDLLLRHGGDEASEGAPRLSLRAIIDHLDHNPRRKHAIILDLFEPFLPERFLIDFRTAIITRARRDEIRPYRNGANSFTGALAEALATLGRGLPSFTLGDVIGMASSELNSWHNSEIASSRRDLSSLDNVFIITNSNNSDLSLSFVPPTPVAWQLDPDNFSSINSGSREDGIQALVAASRDEKLADSATALLNYFKLMDPSPAVREAAKDAALSWVRPLDVKATTPSRIELQQIIPEWCFVERGLFWMGGDIKQDPDALPEEFPFHQVFLPDFSISRDPISVRAWRLFSRKTPSLSARGLDHPVTGVSWYDASMFADWLTECALRHDLIEPDAIIRLPSEAQWEKAARGTDGRIYPWGSRFELNHCNCRSTGINRVVKAGNFPRGTSLYGLQDASGNVWEWTRSNWGKGGRVPEHCYPYDSNDGREDQTAPADVRRVIRGGSHYYFDNCVRCATRNVMFPRTRHSGGGFRLVCEPR